MQTIKGRYWLIIVPFLCATVTQSAIAKSLFTHRLVYTQSDLDKKGVGPFVERLKAAADIGYNGIIPGGDIWGFGYLEDQTPQYLANVQRAVAESKKSGITIIPAYFNQMSASIDDLNLSEAFLVRGTPFLVANGKARAMNDSGIGLKNGSFEEWENGKPTGWRMQSLTNESYAKDEVVKRYDNASLRIFNTPEFARIYQTVKVKPFRAYKLTVWMKTKSVANTEKVRFIVDGRTQGLLGKRERPFGCPKVWSTVSPTNPNWSECVADFNSLNNTSATVALWFCYDDPQSGTIWVDGLKVEEVGLYETIRRRTCPIVVQSQDGSKTYEENKDYVVDPKCNIFTKGSYWYQGHLTIPTGSAIQDGQILKVDWHQFADVEGLHSGTNFCLPVAWDAMKDDLERIDEAMGHNQWMWMGFDEWRVAFWDESCQLMPAASHAGQYMAKTMQFSQNLLWCKNPCREITVWNDMYDPYGNNWKPYGMTNGGTMNAWKGLDSNVIVINWIGEKWAPRSYAFYMGLDDSLRPGVVNRQILTANGAIAIREKMAIAEPLEKKGGRGLIGVVYMNWDADYTQMLPLANACKDMGRWTSGPLPARTTCRPASTQCTPGIASRTPALPAAPDGIRAVGNLGNRMRIEYDLSAHSRVEIRAVDLHGRTVDLLVDQSQQSGRHQIVWNTSNLPAGMYFLQFSLDGILRKAIKQVVL